MLRPIRRRRLRRNSLPAGATRLAAGKLLKATDLGLVAFDSLGGESKLRRKTTGSEWFAELATLLLPVTFFHRLG